MATESSTGGNGQGGNGRTPTAAENTRLADLRTLTSVLLERYQFMRQAGVTFGGLRDEYEIFGYDRLITNRQYREEYARGGIAGRIVDALPNATWRGTMEIIEDEDPEITTTFEQAWKDLDTRLQIQAKLLRVDKLAGLSAYAVLLIGAPGDLSDELPKGKPDKLLYLTPFSGGGGPGGSSNSTRSAAMDADCTIMEYETEIESPRFGLPKLYQLRRTDIASPALQRPVHWTRIIHIAENLLDDDVYGQPALERVWNLLADLRKVTGGGAEAFWLRANQGLHLNIDKDMALADAKSSVESLKEQSEEYKHQMTRWLRTRGVDVRVLGSDVANFANPADAILTQIAGAKAIPKRILTGSEMGELASSQDRDNWKDQVNGRQTGYAGPYIVRPLVDRLIAYGYLPTPQKGPLTYEVRWPQIQTLTEQEKSSGAASWAATVTSDGKPVFLNEEIRDKWYGMAPLTPEQLAAASPPPPEAPPEAPPIEPLEEEVEPKPRAALAGPHTFSSTQIQLPDDIAEQLFAFGRMIPDEDLAADGRETDAHITVKYGLHTNDPGEVEDVLREIEPITFTMGMVGYFAAEGYDVVIVEIKSPDLRRANALISQSLEVTDTYPVYKPHATIAYVKSGLGAKYVGNSTFAGQTATVDTLLFCSAEGERTPLTLFGRLSDESEQELLQVLAAAIEAGNEDVIAQIVVPRAAAPMPDRSELPADPPALHTDWQATPKGLTRRFTFDDRRKCAAFIASLEQDANISNHHPDLESCEDGVIVTYTTHIAGDTVTDLDYQGARRADRLAETYRTLAHEDGGEITLEALGGAGSGNFGHAGRPGEVGGSSTEEKIGAAALKIGEDEDPATAQMEILKKTQGRWFASTIAGAKDYGDDVYYVDIPKDDAKKSISIAGQFTELVEGARHDEFVISSAHAKNQQPFNEDDPPPPPAEGFVRIYRGSTPYKTLGGKGPGHIGHRGRPGQVGGSQSGKTFLTTPRAAGGPGSGNFGHAGRPGEVGGSAPDGGNAPWQSEGGFEHTGITWKQPTDPVTGRPIPIRVNTVEEAAALVYAGKVVEVKDIRTAHTLITELARMSNEAKAAGKEAKDYDLCNVTVPGSSLFCAESVRTEEFPDGIPRIEMPQLGGRAIPGSEADKLPHDHKDEVDGSAVFLNHLQSIGMKTTAETVPADSLKATQRELVGRTVGDMLADPTYDPGAKPIFISSDDYVLDGHHRWAAVVARDAEDGRLGDSTMKVIRVNALITELLPLSGAWSEKFGIAQAAGVKKQMEATGLMKRGA